jgi:hypothetical protein
MLLPPAQYDHPPTIPVIERVLPWNELQRVYRGVIEREKFTGGDKGRRISAKLSDSGAATNSLLAGSFSGSRITGTVPAIQKLGANLLRPGGRAGCAP